MGKLRALQMHLGTSRAPPLHLGTLRAPPTHLGTSQAPPLHLGVLRKAHLHYRWLQAKTHRLLLLHTPTAAHTCYCTCLTMLVLSFFPAFSCFSSAVLFSSHCAYEHSQFLLDEGELSKKRKRGEEGEDNEEEEGDEEDSEDDEVPLRLR